MEHTSEYDAMTIANNNGYNDGLFRRTMSMCARPADPALQEAYMHGYRAGAEAAGGQKIGLSVDVSDDDGPYAHEEQRDASE